jgi:replication fork protection complex subunit Tof1/Swi1
LYLDWVGCRLNSIGDLIAALTWPIDVQQELKEMQDEPNVVTDYASLLRAQIEYKVGTGAQGPTARLTLSSIRPYN